MVMRSDHEAVDVEPAPGEEPRHPGEDPGLVLNED
jgi:hypothetical protein